VTADPAKPARWEPGSGLWCALCLFNEPASAGDVANADTIINGQAVCLDHTGYVQGGDFSQALALLKREREPK
jgi:hypothetical protein